MPHPKWGERPLLVAIAEKGQTITLEEVNHYLQDKVASWWLPDDLVLVDELPYTATGKVSKKTLRERYQNLTPATQP